MSAAWGSRLGRIGAWFHPGYGDEARTEFAVEAETLGYPVAWLGFGRASVADLAVVEQILRATSTIVVATAIVNMWTNDAEEVAASYRRITSRYGDRVLLGVGIGHPEANSEYRRPYATMVDYLDRLDAGGVPADRRILAALGPRALRLAAARTLGSHPYLVVPDHTREARQMLGPDVVIAPEQTVVVGADPDTARKSVAHSCPTRIWSWSTTPTTFGATATPMPTSRAAAATASSTLWCCTALQIASLRACAPSSRRARTTSGFRCSQPTARTPCRVTGSWLGCSFERAPDRHTAHAQHGAGGALVTGSARFAR